MHSNFVQILTDIINAIIQTKHNNWKEPRSGIKAQSAIIGKSQLAWYGSGCLRNWIQ